MGPFGSLGDHTGAEQGPDQSKRTLCEQAPTVLNDVNYEIVEGNVVANTLTREGQVDETPAKIPEMDVCMTNSGIKKINSDAQRMIGNLMKRKAPFNGSHHDKNDCRCISNR